MRQFWSALGLILAVGLAQAQGLPQGTVARVNQQAIPQRWLDQAVTDSQTRGLADSPALRGALTDELVARSVLAQQARALKLDQQSEVKARIANAEQSILAAAARDDYLRKHPVTTADLRAEYDAQVAVLNQAGPPQELQLRHIVVKDEAQAADLIRQLKAGAAFEALAKAHSLDPSRLQGGDLGWVLPQTIFPEIAAVVVNVGKGLVAAAPVRTRLGWHVIQVQDKRPYAVPTFDASQAQLRQAVLTRAWSNHLRELLSQATIER
jgi:peptidyl-prolyl cis-trans isomerase C